MDTTRIKARFDPHAQGTVVDDAGVPAPLGPDLFPLEHENMRALLELVDTELSLTELGATPDYPLTLSVIQYLAEYVDCFHHPREDVAFALAANGEPALFELASAAHEQHTDILVAGATLQGLLERAYNDSPTSRGLVLEAGRAYARGLRQHMHFEERFLFPVLSRVLSDEQWRQLNRACKARMDPLFGPNVDPRYRRLRDRVATIS